MTPEERRAYEYNRYHFGGGKEKEHNRYHFGGKKEKMAKWYADNPEKRRATKKRYYTKNRERILEEGVQQRKANPEKFKQKHLKTRYGITFGEKEALLTSQGNCCAICGVKEPGKKGWHTDHCHSSKRVRGVLCYACNTGLGAFKDNPQRLRLAADYLEKLDDPSASIS